MREKTYLYWQMVRRLRELKDLASKEYLQILKLQNEIGRYHDEKTVHENEIKQLRTLIIEYWNVTETALNKDDDYILDGE